MTYIKVIDDLYNGTNIVFDELIEWPAWSSPSSREYGAPLAAKKHANDPNSYSILSSHGMTVLRECQKLEAVLDDLPHHYGGKFPSLFFALQESLAIPLQKHVVWNRASVEHIVNLSDIMI
jgi:hypothetical protein